MIFGFSMKFYYYHEIEKKTFFFLISLVIFPKISRLKINIHICDNVFRSSPPDVFLGKGVLKIYNKCTGEHPSQSEISIKLICNFIEIALRHGCAPVNLLHIFWTPFYKNTYGGLLLDFQYHFQFSISI